MALLIKYSRIAAYNTGKAGREDTRTSTYTRLGPILCQNRINNTSINYPLTSVYMRGLV